MGMVSGQIGTAKRNIASQRTDARHKNLIAAQPVKLTVPSMEQLEYMLIRLGHFFCTVRHPHLLKLLFTNKY